MIALQESPKRVKALMKSKVTVEESAESDEDAMDSEESNRESDAASEASASEEENHNSKSNPGWADVMQKILKTNKPKKKKSIVLSKAKKLTEVQIKEAAEVVPFEIKTDSGEIKREIIEKKSKDTKDNKEEETVAKRRKKETHIGIRVKPSILDRQRERTLQKIATKGVVQLFNVVRQQQMEIKNKLVEVGPLERKREKVMKSIDKRAFLDVLMGGSKSIPVEDNSKSEKVEKEETEKVDKVWSVLRDDFVMGAKLKDWDKKAPKDDEDSTSSEEMDSD